jgi:hypothetical protein
MPRSCQTSSLTNTLAYYVQSYIALTLESQSDKGQCYKTFYARNLRIFVISQSVCPWPAFPA